MTYNLNSFSGEKKSKVLFEYSEAAFPEKQLEKERKREKRLSTGIWHVYQYLKHVIPRQSQRNLNVLRVHSISTTYSHGPLWCKHY